MLRGARPSAKPRGCCSTGFPRKKAPAPLAKDRTRFAGLNETLLHTAQEKFGVAAPFGGPTSSGMLTLHCPPKHVHGLASFLREHGAEAVSVAALDYVYTRENPLYERLMAELQRDAVAIKASS